MDREKIHKNSYIVSPIFKKFIIKTLGVWCRGFLACAGLSTIKTFLVYNGHLVGEEFSRSGFPFGVLSISFLLRLYIVHLFLYDMVHVGIQLINLLTIVHPWCDGHSTSINACRVWGIRVGDQVSRRKLHTHVHLD